MDRNMAVALSILDELLTEQGVFQCQIHFSSSQATIWMIDDPLRYRILDHEVLTDPDICLAALRRAPTLKTPRFHLKTSNGYSVRCRLCARSIRPSICAPPR